jgi:hypothetical protein
MQKLNPLNARDFDAIVEDWGIAKAHKMRVAAAQKLYDEEARFRGGTTLDRRHRLAKQLLWAKTEQELDTRMINQMAHQLAIAAWECEAS